LVFFFDCITELDMSWIMPSLHQPDSQTICFVPLALPSNPGFARIRRRLAIHQEPQARRVLQILEQRLRLLLIEASHLNLHDLRD
jgi:hypothetical protein